jgi:PAS domain S-box-containing protein
MTLLQFVTYLTHYIYIVIGLITIKDYLADRNPTRLNIMLLASSLMVALLITQLITFMPSLEPVRPFAATALIAFPYLLIRVVHMFHPVPRWIRWLVLALFLISTVFLWLPSGVPPYGLLILVGYFGLSQFYASGVFIWGAVVKRGLSRRRFILAALGSAFLGIAILLVPVRNQTSPDGSVALLLQFFAILSGIFYFLAFVPPLALRKMWQFNQLYNYLNRQRSMTHAERMEQSSNLLREAATQVIYGQRAMIFRFQETGELKSEIGDYKLVPPNKDNPTATSEALWNTVYKRQPSAMLPKVHVSDDERHVLNAFNADTIYYVPIVLTEGLLGVLAVLVRGYPLFADDDLHILRLFVEQHALMMEYGQRMDEMKDYTDVLRLSHENERERFFRVSQSLIGVWNTSRQLTMVNPAWERILGYSEDELKTMSVEDLIHEDDRQAFFDEFQKLGRGEDLAAFEARMVGKDGTVRWFSWWVTTLPDHGTIYGAAHDITNIKEKEEEARKLSYQLYQERERLNQVISNTPGVVWETWGIPGDSSRRVNYVSNYIEQMTGYTVEEATNTPNFWQVITHPDDATSNIEKSREVFYTGDSGTSEFRWITKDERILWCLSRYSVIKDETGMPVGMSGITIDVSTQKEAEEIRSRLAAIVDSSQDAIIGHKLDGEITSWNFGAERSYGYRADEIIGQSIETLWFHPPANKLEQIQATLADRKYYERIDTYHRRKDGTVFPVSFVTSPVLDTKGEVVSASTIARDITAQKQIEADLLSFTKRLKLSNKALEEFAYIASHDLQEPLRKVQAFGDRLVTRYNHVLDDTGQDYLRRMQEAAARMRNLISDLLTYSRLSSSGKTYDSVDLGEIITEVIGDFETRLEKTKGQIIVGELTAVEADATQMRQLFQNLISNSLKYCRPGVPPVVEITGQHISFVPGAEPAYRITVRDNGIGFDNKYGEQIFDLFQRLHSHTEYEGTGIGLAICRKIVDQHSGSIEATGTPGEGATFTVVLPLKYKGIPVYE